MKSIIPAEKNPFYIVTPPYTKVSAGVTTLHLLCHYLNLAGESAYIVQYPAAQVPIRSLPGYVTLQGQSEFPGGMIVPPLTQDIVDHYHSRKLTPIVVYPEVFDNPLKASFFGRFILNYPGKLNTKYKEPENFGVAYAKTLAEFCATEYPDHPRIDDILFVPTVDLAFWRLPDTELTREGSCFYAGKLKGIHGETPENVPTGAIEILRSDKMTTAEVRDLFWRSEIFYCYEDTALAIEAILCGCPTVFVRNKYFAGPPLAAHETGQFGWCMLDEDGGIERARATVGKLSEHISSYLNSIPSQIAVLGQNWRAQANARPYAGTIDLPLKPRIMLFDQPLPSASSMNDHDEFNTQVTVSGVAGRARKLTEFPRILLIDTLNSHGIRGVVRRIARGLKNHGLTGFVRILLRKSPKGGDHAL
ncbi:hypothetical protein [Pseudomonas mosselii]|uniref:Uncharacterized protein n=1 Tax=Pseudomonas mosselii TaxID=78327 RepID=A0AA42RYD9_9PSED|nr:hypothetical protein [Pseudomonas mosselii]MDH1630680.1 hypothetical protein [Pseudomonas mosselii]